MATTINVLKRTRTLTEPSTLEGRANYWKTWYNSSLGKGTIKHYIESNKG